MAPMRLKFPNHMQDTIQYRDIDIDHVKKAMREPTFTKQIDDGRVKACKQLEDGRAIVVIYYKESTKNTNDYFIITAYYKDKC